MKTTVQRISIYAFFVFSLLSASSVWAAEPVRALSADAFLNSLGVITHVAQGYNPRLYIDPLRFLGVRQIRDGSKNLSGIVTLHEKTGVRVALIGAKIPEVISSARTLAARDMLLAIEGPNEPNNFPITYQNSVGGGKTGSWAPVAFYQRDLYAAVKADPVLKDYPVFHVSEGGAEIDNVGLQFLTIPENAGTLLPAGTIFADYANAHNYVCGNGNRYDDNQAWNAADPVLNARWDGLYGLYGRTWLRHYTGYTNEQLMTLPRVTTETGWGTGPRGASEDVQGKVLVNTYLAQFKRGWTYTFVYELGEGEGGGGNYGLFHKDWTPKLAATYIHNMTSILADTKPVLKPGSLAYSLSNQPATVHDLLLQKSDGVFYLVVWGEKVSGSDEVRVTLDKPAAVIDVFDVTLSDGPQQRLKNQSEVPLTLSDHALILKISNSKSTPSK